jgi:CO dehydrogenase/acetyl-CoA synthase beta subunit
MTDGIDAGKLMELETLFEYERDNKTISELRKFVEDYEWVLKEQARKLEQARRKESEAEQLRKEADNLKAIPAN